MGRKGVLFGCLTSLLVGTGCLKVHREAPKVHLPQAWQGRALTGAAIADREHWWKAFNDPVLDGLIDRALRTNNNLAAATLKVRKARLEAGLVNTNLTPELSAGLSGETSRDLKAHVSTRSYSAALTLSYEVDLWGKLASTREASKWEAMATEGDRQSTALALVGTTASAYWQVAYLNQRIAAAEASIAYAGRSLELVQVKFDAGAVSRLDLVQAQQALASQRATLSDLQRQRTAARNALAILFDQAPENSVPESAKLPEAPLPAVEPGLPASLLAQRPDLRAAELRLREAWANVDATKASFYPSFTLTGSLGSSSDALKKVLRNPIGTLGAELALPFLQWNTARKSVQISQTSYEIAVVNFRQTLYAALGDVENTLAAHGDYRTQGEHLEASLSLAREAERLTEARYRAGATTFQAWLDAQESRRTAENTLAENRLNRLENLMAIFQALGGGMQPTDK
ncbi:efflux transporter outer membrane subunit [Holophaga foetida]|uniref:efflux transporter outer membrane subunit n=1 Tax=Holophaga foetida TaxID=35839 RepID=UPI000247495C|nr:efflux transporter outer membrane subunit [Holophaga foetida]